MTDLMEVMGHLTEHFRAIEEENRELKEEQRRQMEAWTANRAKLRIGV